MIALQTTYKQLLTLILRAIKLQSIAIGTEINENNYHSQLDEPEYSNDTHDWCDNFESASSDYWHFLGRYE